MKTQWCRRGPWPLDGGGLLEEGDDGVDVLDAAAGALQHGKAPTMGPGCRVSRLESAGVARSRNPKNRAPENPTRAETA